jgi:hypothetical protein
VISLLCPCSAPPLALFTRLDTSTHFRSGCRRFAESDDDTEDDDDDHEDDDEAAPELSAGPKSANEAFLPSAKRYLMP